MTKGHLQGVGIRSVRGAASERKTAASRADKRGHGSVLPDKNENPNLILRTHKKRAELVACTWNAIIGEAEAGGSLGLLTSQSNITGEHQANERACLKGCGW